jgi:hypothetical protein
LYEEFLQTDKLYSIIKQLKNRVLYWFSDGDLSEDNNLIDIKETKSSSYLHKSLTVDFSSSEYIFQLIITVNESDMGKCKITIKRYEIDNNQLLDEIQDEIDVNDVTENYIIDKIGDMVTNDKNPDEIDIVNVEEEEEDGDMETSSEDNIEEIDLGIGIE